MLRPVHFEIPADDAKRCTTFFTTVFGWEFNSWGDEDYFLTSAGDATQPGIGGAIMKKKDPKQPLVNSISVPSVDEYLEKVVAAGGAVALPKMSVPTVGYLAYFIDTEGNIHGLWQEDATAV